jgi:hypothetical protein
MIEKYHVIQSLLIRKSDKTDNIDSLLPTEARRQMSCYPVWQRYSRLKQRAWNFA